jgi:hypothetical protein
MEDRDWFTIHVTKEKDGFLKMDVMNYGITWAKNIEDIGIAVSELIQVVKEREKNFKKIVNGSKES